MSVLPSIFPGAASKRSPAILVLADGTIFRGHSVGAEGHTVAEIVFNTAMTGYQEVLTDPSYRGQIVALTYPHVGNTGINEEDMESAGVHIAGLVMRDCSLRVSNFRATQSLPEYLRKHGIVAIAGVDTRMLTRRLRDKGSQAACILVGDDADKALALAREHAGMAGQDLTADVTVQSATPWVQSTWQLGDGFGNGSADGSHVVVVDFGVKRNVLRELAERGCRVTVVPASTQAQEILALEPDGVLLSNGPGDPQALPHALPVVRELLDKKIPVFGICMGHQLLGQAVGATILKMKTGHHGSNHPVRDVQTGQVYITGQNHEYALDAQTLPENARVTHVSLFDGSLQGFELTDRPAFGFQGHPEGNPGPCDVGILFDRFTDLMANPS